MFPYLVDFRVAGIQIQFPTAALFSLLGIFSGGLFYFLLLNRREHVSRHFILLAVLLTTGLAGGRLGQFFLNLAILKDVHPVSVFLYSGSTITGGMLAAGIALLVFMHFDKHGVMDKNSLAVLAIAFSFAKIFMRMGCYFGGCCYGLVCEPGSFCESGIFSMTYPDDWIMPGLTGLELVHGPRIAAPLVSASAMFVIGAILLVMYRICLARGVGSNRLAGLFLCFYGIYRFLHEFLRDDPFRLFLGPFTTGQWFGLLCIPAGAAAWIIYRGADYRTKPGADYRTNKYYDKLK